MRGAAPPQPTTPPGVIPAGAKRKAGTHDHRAIRTACVRGSALFVWFVRFVDKSSARSMLLARRWKEWSTNHTKSTNAFRRGPGLVEGARSARGALPFHRGILCVL